MHRLLVVLLVLDGLGRAAARLLERREARIDDALHLGGTQTLRLGFDRRQHSNDVATDELLDVVLGPAAGLKQGGNEARVGRHVLESDGLGLDAIVVGTESHTRDTALVAALLRHAGSSVSRVRMLECLV